MFVSQKTSNRQLINFCSIFIFRPFYSVVSDDETSSSDSENFITESNYRTLMAEMMLSVRIRSPVLLRNRTVGEHFAQMDWKDRRVGQRVQVGEIFLNLRGV